MVDNFQFGLCQCPMCQLFLFFPSSNQIKSFIYSVYVYTVTENKFGLTRENKQRKRALEQQQPYTRRKKKHLTAIFGELIGFYSIEKKHCYAVAQAMVCRIDLISHRMVSTKLDMNAFSSSSFKCPTHTIIKWYSVWYFQEFAANVCKYDKIRRSNVCKHFINYSIKLNKS